MRVMNLPPFPRRIEITDFQTLIETRLSGIAVPWPDHSTVLLGYMCHPNDDVARADLTRVIQTSYDYAEGGEPPVPRGLLRIQTEWTRVADVFHIYCDLVGGHH